MTEIISISPITLNVPVAPEVNGKPLVFIPKKPTNKLRGKNIAEIIVKV